MSLVQFVDTFVWQGIEYTLSIDGFLQGGEPPGQFWSGEGITQTANIRATFTTAAITLPVGAWLLIGGLGVLGAARRRKKS